ncbi:MAG: PilZ domain-containing protein [Desulfobacteraceae bacterium]|jgi:hypothetical protein
MVKQDIQERRNGIRVEFETEVTVTVEGVESHYKGSSKDLSLRGVFVQTSKAPRQNTPCQVSIKLQGLEEDMVLKMEGRVVRVSAEGYAIFFDSVDLDTYTHLKNIVRYNSPESDDI